MKIVHISDLHYPETGNTEALIDAICKYYINTEQKPVVVCSGDILETSSKKKHFIEAKKILEKLCDNHFKLLLCPGNHDVKFEGLGPMINGGIRFNNYFSSLLPAGHNYYGDEDNELLDFPIVHKFDDHFFIGLNTLEKEKGIGATGELGELQLHELRIILKEIREEYKDPKIISYLHHHPLKFNYRPEFMKLRDKDEFLDIVKGIHVLLFGHLHFNERFIEDEINLDINIINLGANCTFGEQLSWTEIDTDGFLHKHINF